MVVGLTSCFEESEFPDNPSITFNDIIFKDIGDNNDADSLIVLIDFEDGDGDLGLDPDENAPPFNLKNYFSNKTGQLFDFSSESFDDLMKFQDRAIIDTLPGFNEVTECLNWDTNTELTFSDGTVIEDTIYFQFNPRHNNFLVDFFIQDGPEFREFDFRLEGDCSITFDGRFPVLVDENNRGALEGTIRYRMPSRFFKVFFGTETPLFLRITVFDRSGKASQTIQTPEFTLNSIRRN